MLKQVLNRGVRICSSLPATHSVFGILSLGTVLAVSGCGSATHTDTAEFQQIESAGQTTLVTSSSSGTRTADASERPSSSVELASATATRETAVGSPEWLLLEITRLRTSPADTLREAIPGKSGKFREVSLSVEQVEQEKQRRLEQTIQLASQVITKTHKDPAQEQHFNAAVLYLSDARLQLALSGREEQSQLLAENADDLFRRDPTSFAAMEAASKVLQLTQTLASQGEKPEAKWVYAFARQSQVFATNFPQETHRAAVNLLAAGRRCEQMGFNQEAETCLAFVELTYPGTPYHEQAAAPLRRLRSVGEPLNEFGGSVLDGGYLSIDDLRGSTVLIAFWASNSEEFARDVPLIQMAVSKHHGRLSVVGVNMDREASAATAFVKEKNIQWRNIFFSDERKRGAFNPVASYYGVSEVPQYWLVDSAGYVRSVDLQIGHLNEALAEAIKQR